MLQQPRARVREFHTIRQERRLAFPSGRKKGAIAKFLNDDRRGCAVRGRTRMSIDCADTQLRVMEVVGGPISRQCFSTAPSTILLDS